jgi:tetratricopeptide (TPR) repeat protein
LALRGEARRRLGRLAEAREDFDRVVAGPSADAKPGSLEDSLVAFNREIERGWFLDAVLAWRGKAREQSGDLEGARKDADAALSLNGRCLDALTLRARLAREAGDLETALKDLEAARALLAAQPGTRKAQHARA